MGFKTFYEARSHPEFNPKISAWTILKTYYNLNDYNMFLSFSDIPKIGINPKSKWTSPSGFYAYQRESWDYYKLSDKNVPLTEQFPYAADRPYMVLFKIKPGANVLTVSEYSENDYERDVEKLRDHYSAVPELMLAELMLDVIQASAEKGAFKQHPCSYLWNFTRLLSKYVLKKRVKKEGSDYEEYDINVHHDIKNYEFVIPSRRAPIWNNLLRNVLGYDVILDDVGRFIDLHEDLQTLVLNIKAIDVKGVYENKYRR